MLIGSFFHSLSAFKELEVAKEQLKNLLELVRARAPAHACLDARDRPRDTL